MLVTIITVCYNAVASIESALQSVLSQDYSHIEYIVVDGGSTDGTLQVIDRYRNRISHIISEPDNGLYDALNKGIRKANGQIIGFLHSDDTFYADSIISDVVQAFTLHPYAEVLYGDLLYKNKQKVVRVWKSGVATLRKFRQGWMPPHPTFFARKSSYQKYGLYLTQFKYAADYELMLRFFYVHKCKFVYLPKFLVVMKTGGISNKNIINRVRANFEDRMAWSVNKLKRPFYTPYLKPILKLNQFRWL